VGGGRAGGGGGLGTCLGSRMNLLPTRVCGSVGGGWRGGWGGGGVGDLGSRMNFPRECAGLRASLSVCIGIPILSVAAQISDKLTTQPTPDRANTGRPRGHAPRVVSQWQCRARGDGRKALVGLSLERGDPARAPQRAHAAPHPHHSLLFPTPTCRARTHRRENHALQTCINIIVYSVYTVEHTHGGSRGGPGYSLVVVHGVRSRIRAYLRQHGRSRWAIP
jgi:hypothetical protein